MVKPQSAKVMIKLKMGSGRKPLSGFEAMHDHTGVYDTGKSWEQNFIHHFGVSLNPREYLIRRQLPSSTRHDLKSEVGIFVNEFKKVRKIFTATILSINTPEPIRRERRPPPRTSMVQGKLKVKIVKKIKLKTEPSSQPPRDDDEISNNSNETAPLGNRSPPSPPVVNFRHVNGSATITRSPTAAMRRRSAPPTDEEEDGDDDVFEFADSPNERVRPPTPRRTRFEEDLLSNLPSDEPIGRPDDNMSQYTTGSQDSQDDLAQLGIPYEEIKPHFIQRAMEKFTNNHLLEVRRELIKSRDNPHSGRWMKWTRFNPMASLMVRELFEI